MRESSPKVRERLAVTLFAAVVSLVVVGLSGGAYAQYAGGLTLSSTTASVGSTILVEGEGYARRTEVVVTFESDEVELARLTTDERGAFSTRVRMPPDAAPGKHTIHATGEARGGGTLALEATVTIKPVPGKRGLSPLKSVGIGTVLGVAALATLAALTILVRRARVRSAHAGQP